MEIFILMRGCCLGGEMNSRSNAESDCNQGVPSYILRPAIRTGLGWVHVGYSKPYLGLVGAGSNNID